MKGPLIATAVVLVFGGASALWQQSRIKDLEKSLHDMHEEAARKGVSLRISASEGRRIRGEEDRNSAHQVKNLMSLLENVEAIERDGGRADDATYGKIVEGAVGLMDLSPSNLRKVLAQMRENPSLSDEAKAKVIGDCLLFLSSEHAEAALQLFLESKELLGKGVMANHVVSTALQSWAEKSPEAAMQWLKSHDQPPGGMTREEMQHAVLGGAAKNDPATAFRLLSEMGLEGTEDACEVIASALADTQRGRESLLQAMRGYVAGVENPRAAGKISGAVMEALGRGVGKNSYEVMTQWLDRENLPESDLAAFAQGLSWFSTGSQTGQWLDWMAQRLPPEKLTEPVEGMVGDWVEADYQAAGKWLTQLPEGSLKTPAVKAYAEAVAAYDPEIATQWAMTIRDADARRRTLQAIYENWPAGDEAGGARFAAQHGLE